MAADIIEDMTFGDEETLKELLEKQANGELEDGFEFDFFRYSKIFGTEFRWDVPYKVVNLDEFKEIVKKVYEHNISDYEGDYLELSPDIYCCSCSNPSLGFHIWGKNDYHDCIFNFKRMTFDEYQEVMNRLVSTLGEVDKNALREKINGHEQVVRKQTEYLEILNNL